MKLAFENGRLFRWDWRVGMSMGKVSLLPEDLGRNALEARG